MSKFGYSKNESVAVNLDTIDSEFSKIINEKEPSFSSCISCGSCTATCSAGNFTDFNIRKIQLMVKRGELESIKPIISRCMLCGKCQLTCPKGLNTRNIILQISKHIDGRKI